MAVPTDFVATCQRVLSMLYASAQLDMMRGVSTPAIFALAVVSPELVTIDAHALNRSSYTGNSEDVAALTPDGLPPAVANDIFLEMAGCLAEDEMAVRITHDVWLPLANITPEGVAFFKSLRREQQLGLPGAIPLWVCEFLSPGGRFYGRSSHHVGGGGQIEPADLYTAVVVRTVDGIEVSQPPTPEEPVDMPLSA